MLRQQVNSVLRSSSRAFSATGARKLAKAEFIGLVTADITDEKVRQLDEDKRMLNYSVAVSTGPEKPAKFFDIAVFSDAQIDYLLNNIQKGSLVRVETNINPYAVEKEDGSVSRGVNFSQRSFTLLRRPKQKDL